jgi:hypothetical protein
MLVLSVLFQGLTVIGAQEPPEERSLPDSNFFQERLIEYENGVPVRKGEILPPEKWPEEPARGRVGYTSWGALWWIWVCAQFDQLGSTNNIICGQAEVIPYKAPVISNPLNYTWACSYSTNVLIYSAHINIGACGWRPPETVTGDWFAYTDEAYANMLVHVNEVLAFYAGGIPDLEDPDVARLNAILEEIVQRVNENKKLRLHMEQYGTEGLSQEDLERLLNLFRTEASCQAIVQEMRDVQLGAIADGNAAFTSFAQFEMDVLSLGLGNGLGLTWSIGTVIYEGFGPDKEVSSLTLAQAVMQPIEIITDPGGEAPIKYSNVLTFVSAHKNLGEAMSSYESMSAKADFILDTIKENKVRCTPAP